MVTTRSSTKGNAGKAEPQSSRKPEAGEKRKPVKQAKKAAPESKRTKLENGKSKGDTSSTIVEKGIIYFVTRARVDVEDPNSTADLQRSFIVLRPLPLDADLKDGAIPDAAVSRVIAIPKKTLPGKGHERFMVFIEQTKKSMAELKESFFTSTTKETKTKGTRTTPPITPIGEGVYAVTFNKNTSHLAYELAIPKKLGEVQKELGIHDKGSFVLSFKNPKAPAPSYANLGKDPELPSDIDEKFRGRRWMPVDEARLLNYENAQLLLIGEGQGEFGAAIESGELDKLEDEEEERIQHLKGDDTIFDDLHISKGSYPALKSTW